MRRSRKKAVGLAVLLLAAALYLGNASWLAEPRPRAMQVLAHRGIAQQFDRTGLDNDTCTAARMRRPTHPYLENSLPSIAASFAAGADVVEIDVHPTTDGEFAVFHDWRLECRTNGRGVTRDHSMAELRQLDIGYGYTADGGRSFPFRGRGIGMMPSLDDVLARFPHGAFLINIKSNDRSEGLALARALDGRSAGIMVYGGDAPVEAFANLRRDVRTLSKARLKRCLLTYIAIGWSGVVPRACADSVLFVPVNVGPWLWGWPDRFLGRMETAGSVVFAIGPYRGGFSDGIDTPRDLRRLPEGYCGGVMTNELPAMMPYLKPDRGSLERAGAMARPCRRTARKIP